jgi:hypothetical protein
LVFLQGLVVDNDLDFQAWAVFENGHVL